MLFRNAAVTNIWPTMALAALDFPLSHAQSRVSYTATEPTDHKGRTLDEKDTGKETYLMCAKISWGSWDSVEERKKCRVVGVKAA